MCNFLNLARLLLNSQKSVISVLLFALMPTIGFAASIELDSLKVVTTTDYPTTAFDQVLKESPTGNSTTALPDWVVRVKGKQDSRGKAFDCSGVAVAPNWVITSTSCTGKINLASCLEVTTAGDNPQNKGIKGFLPSYFLNPSNENLDKYDFTVIQLSESLSAADFPKINTEPLDEEQLAMLAQNFHLVDSKEKIANSGEYLVPILDKGNSPSFYFTSRTEDINKLKNNNFILYTNEQGADVLYALCAPTVKGEGVLYNCQSVARTLDFIERSIRFTEWMDNFPGGPPNNKWPELIGQYNYTMPDSWWVPWAPGCYDPDGGITPSEIYGLLYGGMAGAIVLVAAVIVAMVCWSCPSKKSSYTKLI